LRIDRRLIGSAAFATNHHHRRPFVIVIQAQAQCNAQNRWSRCCRFKMIEDTKTGNFLPPRQLKVRFGDLRSLQTKANVLLTTTMAVHQSVRS